MTDKKREVRRMFDGIAPTYDLLNHLLSLGIDHGWRKKTAREAAVCSPHTILDVATGTGDLAVELAHRLPEARITGVDISEGMLDVGRGKITGDDIELLWGDAEALEFPDDRFDLVTCGFGVRNFGSVEKGLREMCRVTKTGGRCLILEFSQPRGSLFASIYRWYFHRVLPAIGRAVSRDKGAYDYLPRSVGEFPSPEEFSRMLRRAGFSGVGTKKLTLGVAYLYICTK